MILHLTSVGKGVKIFLSISQEMYINNYALDFITLCLLCMLGHGYKWVRAIGTESQSRGQNEMWKHWIRF